MINKLPFIGWVISIGVSISLSVPFWFFVSRTDRSDIFVCMAFAAVAGAASFVMLRPSTHSANAA